MQVVQGVIFDHRDPWKVLMTYRGAAQSRPFLWEYPGGKVEPGESWFAALERELHEELGIRVERAEQIDHVIFPWWPGRDGRPDGLDLIFFWVKKYQGTPTPIVASNLDWWSPEYAFERLPCLPGVYASHKAVLETQARIAR